jgi:hypothetical protein
MALGTGLASAFRDQPRGCSANAPCGDHGTVQRRLVLFRGQARRARARATKASRTGTLEACGGDYAGSACGRRSDPPAGSTDRAMTVLTIPARPRRAHARVIRASRIGTAPRQLRHPQPRRRHQQPQRYQRSQPRYRRHLLQQRPLRRHLLRAQLQKSPPHLHPVAELAKCGSTKARRCITAPATDGTARPRKVSICPRRRQWLKASSPITAKLASSATGILGPRGSVSWPYARCLTRTTWTTSTAARCRLPRSQRNDAPEAASR